MRRLCALVLGGLLLAGCGGASGIGLQAGAGGKAGARSEEHVLAARIDSALDAVAPRPVEGNSLELLIDGQDGFDALERAVRAARKSVWFETFIWHNDRTGQRFAKLLAERKRDGLDVRVLVDPLGTMNRPGDRDVFRVLLDHGVPVRYYRQRVFGSLMNVTHRKLYLLDGDRGFTGGMNIGDEYAHTWHDLLVDVKGPVARDMHRIFGEDWNVSGEPDLKAELISAGVAAMGNIKARTLKTNLNDQAGGRDLGMSKLAALKTAQKSIKVAQLFLSDDTVIEHLERASKRGVDVKVLIARENDQMIFREFNKYYGGRMRKAGIQVRFYEERFSHVKYVSVDGAWILLGSANADTRSYEMNQEFSLGISDPEFTQECDRRVFDRDFATARVPSDAELRVSWTKMPVVKLADWLSYYL
ncbi:MAG: phosphatidylserine/phosphatidylglycerophosphate/cardiolipin synthase family protein [Candidatus Sericytochromatia bacterium]|nr:phosphatidylserine/phosphatidylglycerophosphate/cardiolipin synthase family protein [Candidatus Tanganyikabacteria bacterium]